MLTGLLFSRAFCRPSRVTAGTMGPMEGANWTVRTCICSHWLCGPLECYWSQCGRHGCSCSVPRGGFCHLPPTHPSPYHPSPSHPTPPHLPSHPPLPVPPHPAPPPIPPTPSIIDTDGRKGRQKNLEIQPSETEKVSYNRKQ